MPDITTNLGLKKPVGTESVTRAAYNENLDILDNSVANKTAFTALQQDVTAHKADTATAHGAVAAATASKIIIRDANGRAQVGSPSVAADIARKDTVDAVQTNLNTHKADTTQHLSIMTTQGDMIYRDTSAPTRLAKGAAYTVLGMNSGATGPQWMVSLQSLMTAKGDLVYASAVNTPVRLAIGSNGQYLVVKSDGTIGWGDLNVIQPTKQQVAELSYNGGDYTGQTWYTIVNVTSGKGLLSHIGAMCGGSGPGYFWYQIRVTIDGVLYTLPFLGSVRGNGRNIASSGQYFPHTYFNSSLKIEIQCTAADTTSYMLGCAVDYSLV